MRPHAPYGRLADSNRVNTILIRYVWTQIISNTEKKISVSKYQDTCGQIANVVMIITERPVIPGSHSMIDHKKERNVHCNIKFCNRRH